MKGTASWVQIDVTDDKSVDAAAAQIASQYGKLDILVNNAGIISLASPPSREALRQILDVNVVGALSTTKALLDLLRKAPEKGLVFVSSSTGCITHAVDPKSPYYSPLGTEYRTSKAAVNMLMVIYQARLKDDGFKVLGADRVCVLRILQGNQSRCAIEALQSRRMVAAEWRLWSRERRMRMLGGC